jgi:stage III sporulation protein AC
MDVSMIMKVAGIGLLVAVATQVLGKTGRDDQATMVTVTGLLVALGLIVGGLSDLIGETAQLFGL